MFIYDASSANELLDRWQVLQFEVRYLRLLCRHCGLTGTELGVAGNRFIVVHDDFEQGAQCAAYYQMVGPT